MRITAFKPYSPSILSCAVFLALTTIYQSKIHPHRLLHGTSSIYEAHFKKHGISATYPPALENLIQRVRSAWDAHSNIHPKTEYWLWFLQRYDNAKQHQKIEINFSSSPSITQEYTLGARRGGEWIRELRGFLRAAKEHPAVFTAEEKETLLEAEEFIQILDSVPPMAIAIKTPVKYIFTFGSLDAFQTYIKQTFPNWSNPQKLQTYLKMNIEGRVAQTANSHHYSDLIGFPIPPQNLTFEILQEPIKSSLPKEHPKIPFDTPTTLTYAQTAALKIHYNGFSELTNYADSRFTYEPYKNGTILTRKTLTAQDINEKKAFFAQEEKKKAIRQRFISSLAQSLKA
jgi:hypothetical protein